MGGDETRLLAALNVYWTWHSAPFLAAKGLIPPDWDAARVDALAGPLAAAGLVTTRWSFAKDQPMHRITLAGQEALRELTAPVEAHR